MVRHLKQHDWWADSGPIIASLRVNKSYSKDHWDEECVYREGWDDGYIYTKILYLIIESSSYYNTKDNVSYTLLNWHC
jgi:hypothetical protein